MQDLNFHHLRYFWLTAREGSVTRASQRLRVSPSTVSTQIHSLEDALGMKLFVRKGRNLVLTPDGEVVRRYADDIFSLGEELLGAVRGGDSPRHTVRLRIGVSQYLPKMVAYQLLQPVLKLDGGSVHLVCTEDDAERLVAELAVHQLDLVLSDAPVGLAEEVRLHSHLLGECGVTWLGAGPLYRRYRDGFPGSLDAAPVLLPDRRSAMRRLLEDWFAETGVRPHVVAELGDSALLKSFGGQGAGLFPVPSVVRDAVASQYGVSALGELPGVRERFFAISSPGRLETPPIHEIVRAAAGTFGVDSMR